MRPIIKRIKPININGQANQIVNIPAPKAQSLSEEYKLQGITVKNNSIANPIANTTAESFIFFIIFFISTKLFYIAGGGVVCTSENIA